MEGLQMLMTGCRIRDRVYEIKTNAQNNNLFPQLRDYLDMLCIYIHFFLWHVHVKVIYMSKLYMITICENSATHDDSFAVNLVLLRILVRDTFEKSSVTIVSSKIY